MKRQIVSETLKLGVKLHAYKTQNRKSSLPRSLVRYLSHPPIQHTRRPFYEIADCGGLEEAQELSLDFHGDSWLALPGGTVKAAAGQRDSNTQGLVTARKLGALPLPLRAAGKAAP